MFNTYEYMTNGVKMSTKRNCFHKFMILKYTEIWHIIQETLAEKRKDMKNKLLGIKNVL